MAVKKVALYQRNGELKPGMVFPEGMQRIALGLEYNGLGFHGFQKQTCAVSSVQQVVEQALSKIADEAIALVCAGRTDAGVHASEQVIHFDTLAQRPLNAWVKGVNTHLPDAIRVHWACQVKAGFHARFSALARTYRYIIYPGDIRPAALFRQITHIPYYPDCDKMQNAGRYLLGEHDFSAFRGAGCQAQSPWRRIDQLQFYRQQRFIVMQITANAFLYRMVRNIVGVMLEIGRGAKPVSWAEELLALGDRTQAAASAPPWGLYLVKVDYPAHFGLPENAPGPLFISQK